VRKWNHHRSAFNEVGKRSLREVINGILAKGGGKSSGL
jgi:hypothetical protein